MGFWLSFGEPTRGDISTRSLFQLEGKVPYGWPLSFWKLIMWAVELIGKPIQLNTSRL